MMQIYLVIDDEKKGPFTLFQVEEQLREGTITGDHIGWYDGIEQWSKLRDLPPFEGFFRRQDAEQEDARRLQAAERAVGYQRERAESLPKSEVRPWTRFWARNLDVSFYCIFCFLVLQGMRALGWLEASVEGFLAVIPVLMPVMHLLEAYCLNRWGATPGKALVGIRIVDAEGNLLDFATAVRRSFGVLVMGMAFYIDPLPLITMPIGFYLLMKNRRSFWDLSTGSFVQHEPFRAKHVVWPLAIMFGLTFLFQKPLEELTQHHVNQMEKVRKAINGEQPEGTEL